MKLPFPLVVLALNACVLSSPLRADEAVAPLPPAAADKAWSVVGPWFCTERDWSAVKTLTANGSIVDGKNHLEGQWTLLPQQGQVHLLLRWKDWPSEELRMVNANEFYASNGGNETRMRRQLSAAPAADEGETVRPVETRSWHQGEPPVRLIRQDEGFCALTSVTGRFMGYGELVKVYVAEDGYWYLGGTSGQEFVAAQCIVVRFHAR